ncbi:hypothetical protein JL720_16871 [Aureococcus anophagefferens]|nr:hypothetical protein JL720_16871 [Aureococcus anophagefferens]
MRVHNTMFVDNRAVSGGAAFGWIWSSSVFYNCHFVNNTAVGTPYFGGGGVALNTDGANATYDTCVFSNNACAAAALFADYGSWVSVKDCTFEHNRAYLGGALFADNRAARIGSTGHVATSAAACARVVTGANDSASTAVVRDGRASGSDDDTYDDDDVAAVADDPGAEVMDDPGGAAYMDYTSSPTFSRSVFEHNFAIDAGGAIGGDGSTTFTLDGSRVVGNRARYSGGGIYLGTYGAVHGGANNLPRIHDSVVAGNDALWNGEKDLFLFALDDAFIISAQIGEEAFTLAPVSMPDGFGPVTDDEAAVPPMETIDPPRNASSDDDAKATHAARPTRRA